MVLYFVMLIASKTSRHFTYNVTLWCGGITIVGMKMQQCVPFLGLTSITVNIVINTESIAMVAQQCILCIVAIHYIASNNMTHTLVFM